MQISQPAGLPSFRHVRASDVEQLEEAQPQKRRHYLQLEAGQLHGELVELRLPGLQVFRERLDLGMRIEAAPPRHLVPFAVGLRGAARFCGEELGAGSFGQASGGEWDFRCVAGIDYVCCVFDRERFEQAALDLTGRPAKTEWFRSRVRPDSRPASSDLGRRLLGLLSEPGPSSAQASDELSRQVEADLLQRTIAALGCGDEPHRVDPPARRRRALRRALEMLEGSPALTPTIPELCRVAGVSQRTLEYAFREQLGVTPVRYLKLVRLNRARRKLRSTPRGDATVTSIALACGFSELGRFAGEYRRLFGESPSETLQRD